jgi:hypothetical protein
MMKQSPSSLRVTSIFRSTKSSINCTSHFMFLLRLYKTVDSFPYIVYFNEFRECSDIWTNLTIKIFLLLSSYNAQVTF